MTDQSRYHGLSVIIPTFNEERGIGPVISRLQEVLMETGLPFEILVVDDGSTDGTAAAVERSPAQLLRHPANCGYGAAIKTGIRKARYELICITDADGTYPAERIPDLVKIIQNEGCDMAVGARNRRDVQAIRRPAKWVIGRLAELSAGRKIPDINSGLRIFRRDVALNFLHILPEGFSLTTTITLAMFSNHYEVCYLPIDYSPRIGTSKIRPVRDTVNFILLITRISLYFAPLKVFMPLSMLLGALSLAWGLISFLVLGQLADLSTLVIFMSAVQLGAIGMVAELVNRRSPNTFLKRPEMMPGADSPPPPEGP